MIGLAASAGGLRALDEVLTALPADLPAALVVVQHLDRRHPSMMASILARHTGLRVKEAEDHDHLEASTVYVAPPDRHLLVNPDGTLSLVQTPLVHFVRPSADLMFESLAASYDGRAIAVVLTGSGSDGSGGVRAIRERGGTVVVQDLESSEHRGMPQAAIETGCADAILPLSAIASALVELVKESSS